MRYSLKSLMLFLAFVSVACGGLLWGTPVWSQCIFFFTFLTILGAIILALFAPQNRTYWVSFALAATTYFYLTVCPGGYESLFPTSSLMNLLHRQLVADAPQNPMLPTYYAPAASSLPRQATPVAIADEDEPPTVPDDEPLPAENTATSTVSLDQSQLATPTENGGAPVTPPAPPTTSPPTTAVLTLPPSNPQTVSPYFNLTSATSIPYVVPQGQFESQKQLDRLRIGHCVFAVLLGLAVAEVAARFLGQHSPVGGLPDPPVEN